MTVVSVCREVRVSLNFVTLSALLSRLPDRISISGVLVRLGWLWISVRRSLLLSVRWQLTSWNWLKVALILCLTVCVMAPLAVR